MSEGLKKKFFDTRVVQTAVLVQFTVEGEVVSDSFIDLDDVTPGASDNEPSEFVHIRKF